MKLSFVIPAYNEEGIVGKCLDSIVKQAQGRNDIEIIVVNNASTDKTAEVARSFPGVTVVDEPHKGIVWARRAGFLASHGDLIANVDADTMLTPNWIEKVFAAFSKDKDLVAFSGPFIYYDLSGAARFWVKLFYYISYLMYIISRYVFRIGSVLQGGNYIVRRDALEKIGGFDTSIEFYGEDTDIARRISKVGKTKFTFRLPMYSSGRRLAKEGALTTGMRYGLNYFWITFFKKPLDKKYTDLRPNEDGTLAYTPQNVAREWAIGILVAMITAIILIIIAFITYSLVETGTVNTVNFIKFEAAARNEALKIDENFDAISSSSENMLKGNLNGK